MKKTFLIIIFSLLAISIWAQREDFFSTISITQNAGGRLGTMDKADEDAYRQAKEMLRNPNSTKKQLRRSGKTLKNIYKKNTPIKGTITFLKGKSAKKAKGRSQRPKDKR